MIDEIRRFTIISPGWASIKKADGASSPILFSSDAAYTPIPSQG
jgi:hypothetical protein